MDVVHIALIADSHFGSVSFGFLRISIAVPGNPSNKPLKNRPKWLLISGDKPIGPEVHGGDVCEAEIAC